MKPIYLLSLVSLIANALFAEGLRPNIILLMTDDQGWGQMGYYDHPHLKTPELDAMAANGLRLDRFYASATDILPAEVWAGCRQGFRGALPTKSIRTLVEVYNNLV